MIRPEAFALLAAGLSIACTLRGREHAPVAFVLCLSAARDVFGAIVELPCRLDIAWLLVVLCAQGWAYERTWAPRLVREARLWIGLAIVSMLITSLGPADLLDPWRRNGPLLVASIAAAVGGVHMAMSRRSGWADGVASQTCLVLLAGDVGGLLSGFDDATIATHASLQLLTASIVQIAWLAKPRAT